ncbi:MAG: hypothetical protein HYW34_00140 [Candidatus Brennerbacteria bacterium]|nr:hypothetical protein [Candidatus Brennerbacteria bacterium]
MQFIIDKNRENIISIGRKIGYFLIKTSQENEFNFIRPIHGSNYPRFHLYIIEDGEKCMLNLHLDQKKPSYEGSHAHNGEYDGEIVEKEAERIKMILV